MSLPPPSEVVFFYCGYKMLPSLLIGCCFLFLSCFTSVLRTPLHCAASCNNVSICKFLVESGAAVFSSTYSDMQTAADKCEEMEEGYAQCSQFLYGTAKNPELPPGIQRCLANDQLRTAGMTLKGSS